METRKTTIEMIKYLYQNPKGFYADYKREYGDLSSSSTSFYKYKSAIRELIQYQIPFSENALEFYQITRYQNLANIDEKKIIEVGREMYEKYLLDNARELTRKNIFKPSKSLEFSVNGGEGDFANDKNFKAKFEITANNQNEYWIIYRTLSALADACKLNQRN